MAAHYDSKHGIVAVPPEQLYMSFTDMRNLTQSLPEKYRDSVTADFDSIHATVQGFSIAVRVVERNPYSLLRLEDDDAPFHFRVAIHFDPAAHKLHEEMGCICFENHERGIYFIQDPDGYWLEILPTRK